MFVSRRGADFLSGPSEERGLYSQALRRVPEMGDAAEKLIEELVDDAFAPFVGLLSPDVMAAFREELADALALHPQASLLVRRALPDPTAHKSGEVDRDEPSESSRADQKKDGTGST
jgi:hypothetical protein